MKSILISFVLIQTSQLFGQQRFSQDQLKVQETVVKVFEALSDRDSIALRSYCTPDITFYEYGQVWNIDTLIRKAITSNKSASFKRTNEFEFLSTNESKKTAWASYRLTSTIVKEGKQTILFWLETVLLVKEKQSWKLKHLHSTLVKKVE